MAGIICDRSVSASTLVLKKLPALLECAQVEIIGVRAAVPVTTNRESGAFHGRFRRRVFKLTRIARQRSF
jgi:hypothetical protein